MAYAVSVMPRNLEASLSPERNLLLYDDNGTILGGQYYSLAAWGMGGTHLD